LLDVRKNRTFLSRVWKILVPKFAYSLTAGRRSY